MVVELAQFKTKSGVSDAEVLTASIKMTHLEVAKKYENS